MEDLHENTFGDLVPSGQLFKNDEKTVEEPPHDKIPGGTMPNASDKKDNEQIEEISRFAHPVSAQRNIKIFLEPSRKRDMPSAPELRNGKGDVRIIEVFEESESEYCPETDGHVGITAEIEEELKRICHGPAPGGNGINVLHGSVEDLVSNIAQGVGENDFFPKPDDEPSESVNEMIKRLLPVFKLSLHVVILQDGTGDQLRKKRDEQRKIKNISLNGNLPAVNVDEIRHALKGVKRYPQRQDDAPQIILESKARCEVDHYEVEIFEVNENEKISGDEEPGGGFSDQRLGIRYEVDDQRPEIIEDNDSQHHIEKLHISPSIKNHAEEQKNEIPSPPRRQVIDKTDKWQKNANEN